MVDPTFNDGYVRALAGLGTVRSYAKNTVVFQEGDLSDQVYVVVSGKLKVFLADSDGKEVIVDILGARQYFGEMALDGRPRSASVITLEASKLAIVQREQFKRFLSENPEAAFGFDRHAHRPRPEPDARSRQHGAAGRVRQSGPSVAGQCGRARRPDRK